MPSKYQGKYCPLLLCGGAGAQRPAQTGLINARFNEILWDIMCDILHTLDCAVCLSRLVIGDGYQPTSKHKLHDLSASCSYSVVTTKDRQFIIAWGMNEGGNHCAVRSNRLFYHFHYQHICW